MPEDPALAAAFADRDAHEADFRSAVAVRVGQLAADLADAQGKASSAVTEQNRLTELVTQREATIAQLRQQQSSGAVLYVDGMALAANTTYDVPPNVPIGIVVNQPGVTLRIPGPNWPKASQGVAVLADNCTIVGTPGQLTGNAPAGQPERPDGRFTYPGASLDNDGQPKGFGEFIAVASDTNINQLVRNTRIIDVSGGRVNALVKLYPGATDTLIDRPVSTADLRADGIYSGGAKNTTIRNPDLKSKNENTVRGTNHRGVPTTNLRIIGGRVENIGGKAAFDPRNGTGFYAGDATLIAAGESAAVGIGNASAADPGATNVTIERCTMPSGGLAINDKAVGVKFLDNRFTWRAARSNVAISVNANGYNRDVTIIGNGGESPVPQKPMVGYGSGKAADVPNLIERGNAWAVKP